jgi:hypothetical protein
MEKEEKLHFGETDGSKEGGISLPNLSTEAVKQVILKSKCRINLFLYKFSLLSPFHAFGMFKHLGNSCICIRIMPRQSLTIRIR